MKNSYSSSNDKEISNFTKKPNKPTQLENEKIQRVSAERNIRVSEQPNFYRHSPPNYQSNSFSIRYSPKNNLKLVPYIAYHRYQNRVKHYSVDFEAQYNSNNPKIQAKESEQRLKKIPLKVLTKDAEVGNEISANPIEIETESLRLKKKRYEKSQTNLSQAKDTYKIIASEFEEKIKAVEDLKKYYLLENTLIKKVHNKEIRVLKDLVNELQSEMKEINQSACCEAKNLDQDKNGLDTSCVVNEKGKEGKAKGKKKIDEITKSNINLLRENKVLKRTLNLIDEKLKISEKWVCDDGEVSGDSFGKILKESRILDSLGIYQNNEIQVQLSEVLAENETANKLLSELRYQCSSLQEAVNDKADQITEKNLKIDRLGKEKERLLEQVFSQKETLKTVFEENKELKAKNQNLIEKLNSCNLEEINKDMRELRKENQGLIRSKILAEQMLEDEKKKAEIAGKENRELKKKAEENERKNLILKKELTDQIRMNDLNTKKNSVKKTEELALSIIYEDRVEIVIEYKLANSSEADQSRVNKFLDKDSETETKLEISSNYSIDKKNEKNEFLEDHSQDLGLVQNCKEKLAKIHRDIEEGQGYNEEKQAAVDVNISYVPTFPGKEMLSEKADLSIFYESNTNENLNQITEAVKSKKEKIKKLKLNVSERDREIDVIKEKLENMSRNMLTELELKEILIKELMKNFNNLQMRYNKIRMGEPSSSDSDSF